MRLEQLEMLVQQQLPAEEVSTIAEHVQTCICCRQHAEELLNTEGGLSGYYQRLMELSHQAVDVNVSMQTRTGGVPINIQRQFSLDTLGHAESLLGDTSHPSTPRRLGKYEILAKLGEGGFGNVYRARDGLIGREVALKVLKRATSLGVMNSTPEQALLEEARRSCKVDHPNVVQAREVAEADGYSFLVMDLIEGQALNAYLRRGPLPLDQVVQWIQQLCQGLAALHSRDVLHLDIKPSNILINATDGSVKIADIGLERAVVEEGDKPLTMALGGTPAYMSPEQVNQQLVDARSDIFSLGIVFYELLVDARPFQGDISEVGERICQDQPQALRALRRNLPIDVETIVMKCLEKQPERRYASAQEVFDDLQRWKEHRPILAKPISPVRRMALWSRRNAASLAVSLFLAGIALFFMERTYRIGQERAGKVLALNETRSVLSQRLNALARLRTGGEGNKLLATELVEPLVPFYRKILERDRAVADLGEIGEANFRMAYALHILDRPSDALEHLKAADQSFADLSKKSKPLNKYQLASLAAFQLDRVHLYEVLQQPLEGKAADDSLSAAISTAKRLSDLTNEPEHHEMLAFAYWNQGAYLARQQNIEASFKPRQASLSLLEQLADKEDNTTRQGMRLTLHLDLALAHLRLGRVSESQEQQARAKNLWQQYALGDEYLHAYVSGLVNAAIEYRQQMNLPLCNQSLREALQVSLLAQNEGRDQLEWQDEVILVCTELFISDELELLDDTSLNACLAALGLIAQQHESIDPKQPQAFQKLRLLMEAYGLHVRLARRQDRSGVPVAEAFSKLVDGAPQLYGNAMNQSLLAVDLAKEGQHLQSVARLQALQRDSDGTLAYNRACALNYCASAALEDSTLAEAEQTKLSASYAQEALEWLARPETLAVMSVNLDAIKSDLATGDLAWLNRHYPDKVRAVIEQVK